MNLTSQQKETFFNQYEKLLWKTIRQFKRRCSGYYPNEEDLYQECAVVLTNHINTAADPAALHRIPVLDMVNAMCKFVLNAQPVRLPGRTTDFKASMRQLHGTSSLESLESVLLDESIEDVLNAVDMDRFCSQLTPLQRNIVSLKRTNHTNREIARSLGCNDSVITRAIGRVRSSYECFSAEDL